MHGHIGAWHLLYIKMSADVLIAEERDRFITASVPIKEEARPHKTDLQ
jgi:hypothetical protein